MDDVLVTCLLLLLKNLEESVNAEILGGLLDSLFTMSSTPSNLIPQPAQLDTLRCINDLRMYMAATHPTASTFKAFVNRTCRLTKYQALSRERCSDKIDATEWQAYVDEVTADWSQVGTKLLLYEGCWPIRVIHDIRVRQHRRRDIYSSAKSAFKTSKTSPSHPGSRSNSSASASAPIDRSPGSVARGATNIKPPAPALRERREKLRFVPSRQRAVFPTQQSLRSTVASECSVPSPPRSPIPQMKFLSRLPHQVDTASQLSLPGSVSCPREAAVPSGLVHVGCLECGNGPRTIGPNSDILSVIGEGSPEYLRLLYDGGFRNDAHLKIFRAWSPRDQERFITNIPATPFVRQFLLQRLQGPAQSRPSCASTEKTCSPSSTNSAKAISIGYLEPTRTFSGILRPSQALEDVLTDPNQRIELLRSAMELDASPGLFDEVLQFFKRDGFPYLSSFCPSEEETEKAVNAIARERLMFERYENYWPIRFLIKRIVRKRASSSDFSDRSKEHWVRLSTKVTTQESAPVPSRIVYDCPLHAGPDLSRVSPNILLLLSQRGLSEFAPIFAYLGIRTDADFDRFCTFSGEEREGLVENARRQLGRKIVLNVFQRSVLNLEFEADE